MSESCEHKTAVIVHETMGDGCDYRIELCTYGCYGYFVTRTDDDHPVTKIEPLPPLVVAFLKAVNLIDTAWEESLQQFEESCPEWAGFDEDALVF